MAERLEGVVLGGNLLDEVVADEGDLLHNVLSYLGDVGEEEEGEDTGNGTEASSGGTAIRGHVSKMYDTRLKVGGSRVVRARGGRGVFEDMDNGLLIEDREKRRLTYKILARWRSMPWKFLPIL